MSSKVENLGNNKVKVEIIVSAEEFEKGVDQAFKKNASKINIPGFRKGKAPRNIIEKMYGKEIMYNDAFDIVAPDAYENAIKENNLEVVSRPEVDITQIGDGKDLIFTAEVYVKPEVKLGDYKGLKVEKKVYNVSDADIDAEIESMRNKNARLITVEDRALQDGDISNIDFEGFVDNVPFDGGKGTNFELTIGSGQFIPGFEEQLIGMNIKETREINVKFPEEYHSKDLAGKDSMFRVTLNSIKTKEVPALDDEFVKDVSEFDTLAELKEDLKKKATERNTNRSKIELEDELFKMAAKNAEVDIPATMIDAEVDHMVSDYDWRLQMQGMKLEMYLKMMNQDLNTFKAGFRESAEERVKVQLVIDKIAEEEKIEADEKEINEKIQKMAENYGQSVEDFSKNLREDDKKYIAGDVKVQKVADFLVENAKITETEVSKEEDKKEEKKTRKPRTTKAKTTKKEEE
ncbi:MAG: trigger factor [Clostridia bacterium]|nr:trigger factor [Clostridia bacterium]